MLLKICWQLVPRANKVKGSTKLFIPLLRMCNISYSIFQLTFSSLSCELEVDRGQSHNNDLVVVKDRGWRLGWGLGEQSMSQQRPAEDEEC